MWTYHLEAELNAGDPIRHNTSNKRLGKYIVLHLEYTMIHVSITGVLFISPLNLAKFTFSVFSFISKRI